MEIIRNRDAQFMLLAGFIIGIGLVVTTVLLNTIIFESNMAIEGRGVPSKNEIIGMIPIIKDETRSAYRNVTNGTGSTDSMIANYSRQMQSFRGNISRIYGLHGEVVNVSFDTEKWNKTQYANFTENGFASGTANWTLVEGVNASSVDIFKFSNITLSDPGIKIEARNSTVVLWSAEFNTSGYKVTNATNTSYGGSPGSDIDLLSDQYYFRQSILFQKVSIHIVNGTNAYGKFRIQGIANGRTFYRERHYIMNATSIFSTSRLKINMTIPVSVPW